MIESIGLLAKPVVASRIEKIMGLLLDAAPLFIMDSYKKGAMLIDKGLPSYLSAHYSKCETVRTLLRSDTPVILENAYVKPKFTISGKRLQSDDILQFSQAPHSPIVVTGTAGSGKSVFLKWSFRQAIEKGYTFYPVFFEIRSMAESATGNLLDLIFASIAKYADGFTRSQFDYGLKHGLFFLMIDALDEAPIELRDTLEKDLQSISRKYPKCPLILTSRPSDDLKVWEGFTEAHLLPFNRADCLEYIEKIDFDATRKDDFAKALTAAFFEKHKEFLSNPLLAAMMLLTFDEFGEIPQRKHIFYQKCFDVLIREHDHAKGKYKRKLISKLDHPEIEKIFQSFCVFSYLAETYVFNTRAFFKHLEDAMQYCDVSADSKMVSEDLCLSVSIIQKDGDHFEFLHRSFQEYFYAKFCANDRTHSMFEKASAISSRTGAPGIFDMISDIDQDLFYSDLILPVINRFLQSVAKVDAAGKPDLILKHIFETVIFSEPTDGARPNLPIDFILNPGPRSDYNQEKWLNFLVFSYIDSNMRHLGSGIAWPPEERADKFKLKLSKLNSTIKFDPDHDLELPLIPSRRELLKQLGVGLFAQSVVSSFSCVAAYIKEGQKRRVDSLSSRMRAKK